MGDAPKREGFDTPHGRITYEEYRRRMDAIKDHAIGVAGDVFGETV